MSYINPTSKPEKSRLAGHSMARDFDLSEEGGKGEPTVLRCAQARLSGSNSGSWMGPIIRTSRAESIQKRPNGSGYRQSLFAQEGN